MLEELGASCHAARRLPIFGAKLGEARWFIFCLISMLNLLTYIDIRTANDLLKLKYSYTSNVTETK